MAYFSKTNKVKKHDHMLFIGDNGEILGVSPGKGHLHPVDAIPDPQYPGEFIYLLRPAKDKHSHYDQVEIKITEPKTNFTGASDSHIKKILDSAFSALQSYEMEARTDALLSTEYARGKQWPAEDQQNLKASGRACLTLNIIGGMLDSINGYWRQNKQSVVALPIEKRDEINASTASDIIHRILRLNKIDTIDARVRADQHKVGRGFWHIYIDDADNAFGDVKIEHLHWGDAYLGPHGDYNLGDIKTEIVSKYISAETAKAHYPELKNKVNWATAISQEDTLPIFSKGRIGERVDNSFLYRHNIERTPVDKRGYVDFVEDNINVLTYWIREEYAYVALVNQAENVSFETKGWSSVDVNQAATIPGFEKFDRVGKHMREVVKLGEVILKNDINPFYGTSMPVIPAYGHREGSDWWGKVRPMRDLNMDLNKRRSQIIDFSNRMLGGGWFHDSQNFGGDPRKKAYFDDNIALAGFNIEIADVMRPPHQVVPPQLPIGLITIETTTDDLMKRVSNITHEFTGANTGEMSGVAIQENKQTALTGNADYPENFVEAKRLVAETVLIVALRLWPAEYIFELLTGRQEPETEDDQILFESIQSLKGTNPLRYDMTVSESEHSPTRRNTVLMNMLHLTRIGVQVPQIIMIDYFDLPPAEKARWKEALAAQEKREVELQEMKYNAQVQSAAIKKAK